MMQDILKKFVLSFVGQTLSGFQTLRTSKVGLTRGIFIKKKSGITKKNNILLAYSKNTIVILKGK